MKWPRVGTNSPRVAVTLDAFRDVMERAARWIENEANANGFGEDRPEAWQLAVSIIRDQAASDHGIEMAAFCEMQETDMWAVRYAELADEVSDVG